MPDKGFDIAGRRIWVAGHKGMVGSAICCRLEHEGCDLLIANRDQLDLTRQSHVETWMEKNKPDAIIVAAAKVGGILANDTYPAEFIYENLMIEANIIHSAWMHGVKKLLFLGSSCIYPKLAQQPIKESELLSGYLEPTNEWYALAKISGVKMIQAYRRQYGCDFISCMPTNLYGPNDNFDLNSSHVIPALIAKTHKAKTSGKMEIWGTGQVRREFMFVDDLADAIVYLLKIYSADDPINVGTGEDLTIAELADMICDVVGFKGELRYDTSKPDGTPRKLLDVSNLNSLGWKAKTTLRAGLEETYAWYLQNVAA